MKILLTSPLSGSVSKLSCHSFSEIVDHRSVCLVSLLSLTVITGDTKHVLTGSADNSCRLWDCETGKMEIDWTSADNLTCLLFSCSVQCVCCT